MYYKTVTLMGFRTDIRNYYPILSHSLLAMELLVCDTMACVHCKEARIISDNAFLSPLFEKLSESRLLSCFSLLSLL